VIQHPVTTEYEDSGHCVQETLHAINDLNMPALWLWPNMDAGTDDISKVIRSFREKYEPKHIHFFKNFAFEDYARLLNNSACLVGNSSSGIRESAFLGVPAVNIGTRQNFRERGTNVIDVSYDRNEIRQAIDRQVAHGKYPADHLYGDGNSGKKIAEVLAQCNIGVQKKMTY
jgi:UDP-hydrolysing UDP-N-acetyl-D-glucosamine 2-epimerase